ncbi:O-antigen ligase family protein [Mucilaginibacter mali]|uniref:O-antigen ligase family protein n=1 Tax=Mucilaginibacter mali TaxID=2740462 RepID=A0A7D4QB98_9SPHI|nr:O-antigen ligase family protein [Mucilaginibacter mali]QKJ31485.1 O-antigen ligase family protein [Mucilaginibacter mali]
MYNSKKKVIDIGSKGKYFWPVLIFSLFVLPSYTMSKFSEGELRGIYLYFSYYFIEQFLPGIIIMFLIRSEEDFLFYLKCIAFCVFVMCLFGFYEFITSSNPFLAYIRTIRTVNSFGTNELIEYSDESRYGFSRRVQSTVWHPIAYGDSLSMYIILFYIPIVKAYTNKKYSKLSNYLYVIIVMALINIVFTASRTPWIATAVSLTLVQISHLKNFFKRNFVFKAALVGIAIPVAYMAIMELYNYLSKTEISGSSYSMRIDQFNFIINAIGSSLYIGFGPSSIDSFYKTGSFADALGFESILFVFLFYYGVLGLIGLGILYYTSLRNLINKNGKAFYRGFLVIIFISHFIAVMISGELRTLRVFWMIYSMLFAMQEINTAQLNLIAKEKLAKAKELMFS